MNITVLKYNSDYLSIRSLVIFQPESLYVSIIIKHFIVSWTLPEESKTKCLESGGTLRDGFKGYGQYCLLTGVSLDFDESLAKCADLGGSLPIIRSFDEALAYHKIDCSRLNPNAESCSNARSVMDGLFFNLNT